MKKLGVLLLAVFVISMLIPNIFSGIAPVSGQTSSSDYYGGADSTNHGSGGTSNSGLTGSTTTGGTSTGELGLNQSHESAGIIE